VEIQGINVVNLGDSVEMVTLETLGEERSLKHGGSHVRIKMRIKWNEFGRIGIRVSMSLGNPQVNTGISMENLWVN